MTRPFFHVVLCAAVLAAGMSAPRVARAGGAQEQRLAQALFDEGRQLMEKKRYGEACPKLAESQRLDPGGGTLLNLALCHEEEGKLATAKLDYDEALVMAVRDGRKDRQRIARARLLALEPSIPRLRVAVGAASDTEGLEVKLDGLILRRAAWGLAAPVDPGAHVVEVTAPNRTPWSTSILLEASQRKTVDVPPLSSLSPLPQRVR
jgi:tetratricopeptide (TPR) repeat protein